MDCPICNADMEIIDYQFYFDEIATQEWKCACPDCGFKGTFRKVYEISEREWIEE